MILLIYLVGAVISFILITANVVMKQSYKMLSVPRILLCILAYTAFSWFNFIMIGVLLYKFLKKKDMSFAFKNWYFRFLYGILDFDLKGLYESYEKICEEF